MDEQRAISPKIYYVLWALVTLALFLNLGGASLWDIDEGIYGDISREMAERGDLVVPYHDYAPRYDKPPLTFWLSAFFIKMLGATELAVRLPSTLFGVGGMILVWLFGRRLYSNRAGLAGGLILASTISWFIESRMGLVDTALSFFIALSIYAAWMVIEENKPQYYLLLFVGAGLGTLVKGPVAVLLPGGAIFFWVGWRKSLRQLARPWFWAGVAAFIAVAAPWHWAIWQREGAAWLNSYFGYHMFTRFTRGIEQHGQPFYYYIIILLLGFAPWSPLFWSIIRDKAALLRKGFRGIRQLTSTTKLLLWWFAIIFLFFSIARTKLPGYILPAFMPLAILVARWLTQSSEGRKTSRILREYVLTAGIIAVVGLAVLAAVRHLIPAEYLAAYKLLFYFPLLLLAGSVAIWFFGRRYTGAESVLVVVVAVALLSTTIFSFFIQPLTEAVKPVKPLSLAARELAAPNSEVVSMLGDGSAPFYVQRKVTYPSSKEKLFNLVENSDHPLLLMVPKALGEQLAARFPVTEKANHPMAVLLEYKPTLD